MSTIAFATPFLSTDADARDISAPSVYRVGEGETVYEIARKKGLSLKAIVDINGLKRPFGLTEGQELILPGALYHRVVPGETARSIARLHGVNFDEFAAINGLTSPNYAVTAGRDVRLPVSLVLDGSEGGVARSEPKTALGVEGVAVNDRPDVKYIWPLKGRVVRKFGDIDRGVANEGIDIAVPEGSEVRAVASGTVIYADSGLAAYGNLVLLKHADGVVSAYAHNRALAVEEGDEVLQGQVIATSGATGEVSEPRLHFELRRGERPIDPIGYLGK